MSSKLCSWTDDLGVGTKSEIAFKTYLRKINCPYRIATKAEQDAGIDIVTNRYTYECKSMTKNSEIAIEETSTKSGETGWIYKVTAKWLIEVNDTYFLKIDCQPLRSIWKSIRDKYPIQYNKITSGKTTEFGDEWQSTFRWLPIMQIDYSKIEYKRFDL